MTGNEDIVRSNLPRIGDQWDEVRQEYGSHRAKVAHAALDALKDERDEAREDLRINALIREHGCACGDDDACAFVLRAEAADAEAKRLRKALERIDLRLTTLEGDNVTRSIAAASHAREIARAALGEQP
jgi:hypothetical protein